MKVTALTIASFVASASAFAPLPFSSTAPAASTSLDLFGGKKEGGGDAKGPMGGMMDQLGMLKKAQEIASKKKTIEEDLKKMDFEGKSENGKVDVKMKYLPSTNPMDPQPEFSVERFEFDQEWYDGASPEDISSAVKEAYRKGIEATMKGSEEKFKALAEDLQAMMGAAAGGEKPN